MQQFNAECAEGADFFTPLTEQDNACIVRVMLQDDAGPEAVDFFRATGLFLTEFEQIAEVDYAIATAPWVNQGRPNPLLLNGDPSVVSFGDLLGSGSMYRAIGDDILWPEYSTLELYEETDGGQRLTFNVRLAPCRACETTGSLEVVVEIIEGAVFRVSEARTD